MEVLILSGKMQSFPVRHDSRHIHHEDKYDDDEEPELLGLGDNDRREPLPTTENVVGSFPYSHSLGGPSSIRIASPCSSTVTEPVVPTLLPAPLASSFQSECELRVGLNPDLGGYESVAWVEGNATDAVAQVPERLPILSARFGGWNGVNDEARDEDGLAAEDWLDAAEVLDVVAEPKTLSA